MQRKGRTDAACYIAILLEFQSTPDRFMALRLLTYVALLLEELAKDKEVQESGLLPPVQPIVPYSGGQPWTGALDAFLAGLHDDDREVLTAAIRLLVGDTCRRLGIPMEGKEQAMLEENLRRWRDEAVAEARAEGRAEGRSEGRAEGLREAASKMFVAGSMSADAIARMFGLDEAEVRGLAAAQ